MNYTILPKTGVQIYTKKVVTKGITAFAESLLKDKTITTYSGQEFGIFITNQQLHRVARHIIWQDHDNLEIHIYSSVCCTCLWVILETSICQPDAGGLLKRTSGQKYQNNISYFHLEVAKGHHYIHVCILKVLKSDLHPLIDLGDNSRLMPDIKQVEHSEMWVCYGQSLSQTITV